MYPVHCSGTHYAVTKLTPLSPRKGYPWGGIKISQGLQGKAWFCLTTRVVKSGKDCGLKVIGVAGQWIAE